MSDPDPVLSPREVAGQLGVSLETVRRHLRSGELPAAKHGRRYFILRSAVQDFLRPTNTRDVA